MRVDLATYRNMNRVIDIFIYSNTIYASDARDFWRRIRPGMVCKRRNDAFKALCLVITIDIAHEWDNVTCPICVLLNEGKTSDVSFVNERRSLGLPMDGS